MEFIRHVKSQSNYSPNTRHCMYGLDADLVMLGLLSHEPHFSLLREEVVFGRQKKSVGIEGQLFYLLHLSLFRDYLDLEFQSLKECTHYNLERIIDDFILMTFFVGNDFLPHIPGLSINDGALNRIFKIYKHLFPEMGGYMNENGELNLKRVELFVKELGNVEFEEFIGFLGLDSMDSLPLTSLLGPTRLEMNSNEPLDSISENQKSFKPLNNQKNQNSNKKYMTKKQFEYYLDIKKLIFTNESTCTTKQISFDSLDSIDKTFLIGLAQELGLSLTLQEHGITLELDSDEDESDEESFEARQRVFRRFDKFDIYDSSHLSHKGDGEGQGEGRELILEFNAWKSHYYRVSLYKITRNLMKKKGKIKFYKIKSN